MKLLLFVMLFGGGVLAQTGDSLSASRSDSIKIAIISQQLSADSTQLKQHSMQMAEIYRRLLSSYSAMQYDLKSAFDRETGFIISKRADIDNIKKRIEELKKKPEAKKEEH